MADRFLVAQYVPDLFRKEPRNVGVIVQRGANVAARFAGETALGTFDGRRLKSFSYPEVYKQWVGYWRKMANLSDLDAIVRSSRDHYVVTYGGEVTDTQGDPVEAVVAYLYSTLVSDGGLQEALSLMEPAAEEESSSLVEDVKRSFQSLALMDQSGAAAVAHPVRMNAPLRGRALEHRPAFSQVNGATYAMETVDLTVTRRRTAIDHAGLTAYMFKDLREVADRRTNCFSLVRFRDEDAETEAVAYALNMLRNESEVVNWLDAEERRRFVSDRQAVANH